MADQELELLMRLLADTKGADQMQEALNRVKSSSAAVGDVTRQATTATEGLGEAEKETATLTETLHHNFRAFHMLLHEATKGSIPQAGEALGGLAHHGLGLGAAIIAGGAAFSYFNEQLKKANEEMDDFAAKLAETISGGMEQFIKKADDMRDALAKLNASFDVAGSSDTGVEGWLKYQITLIDELQKRMEALNKVNGVPNGPDNTAGQKASATEDAVRMAAAAKAGLDARAVALEQHAQDAEAKYKDAQDTRDMAKKTLDNRDPKDVNSLNNRTAKAEAELAEARNNPLAAGTAGMQIGPELNEKMRQEQIAEKEAALKALEEEQDRWNKLHDQAAGALTNLAEIAARARRDAEAAKSAATSNDASITTNTAAAAEMRRKDEFQKETDRQVRVAGYRQNPGEIAGDVHAVATAKTVAEHTTANNALMKVLGDMGMSTKQQWDVIKYLAAHVADADRYAQEIMKLVTKK